MKSSPICRERRRWYRVLRFICIGAVALDSVLPVPGVDSNRTLSQYVREVWGKNEGFPRGAAYSIQQTKDGYLWIGTEKGLVRFDGLKFQVIDSAAPHQPVLSHVLGLLADPKGPLSLRLPHPLTFLQFDDGVFAHPMGDLALPGNLAAMTLGRDGGPVFCFIQPTSNAITLRNRKLELLYPSIGLTSPTILAIAQTAAGEIWMGSSDRGLFRIRNGQATAITEGLPDLKVNALAPGDSNDLWVATDNGVVRWDGAKLTSAGLPSSLHGIQALALLVDRDRNLWVGTNSQGLARVNARGLAWMTGSANGSGRSGNEAVTALFEDREGDLWAAKDGALERIRDSAFVTYSQTERMPSENNGPVYADRGGRIWFAPMEGGLWHLLQDRRESIQEAGLAGDIVYSIAAGTGGVWIGRQRGGLTFLRPASLGQFSATTYTAKQGLAENSVYSVYESRDGTVWAGTLSGGVSRLRQGHFTTFRTGQGLASNTVASIVESSDGTMWFATSGGLSALSRGNWKTFGVPDGLPSDNINCLLVDSGAVLWIGTGSGISFWNGAGIQTVPRAISPLREEILGIAQDQKGWLWVATSTHILRVNRDKLMRGVLADGDLQEFTIADGLRGTEGVKRSRTVISDEFGRIWFSTNRGLSVVDPSRLSTNSAPAIVQVEMMAADAKALELKSRPIHVQGGTKRLTVEYAGLSLSVPERVRFRYMLEGFESDFSSPVTTREAVFTNLAPGPYRFRVIASNPDGFWNPQEAVRHSSWISSSGRRGGSN